MTVRQLAARYAELFGALSQSNHRLHLLRRVAWRIQALAEGALSERARQRALEIATGADVRSSALKDPAPVSHNAESPIRGREESDELR
jgi:hypothetical protein